jgi:leucyl aminopeptidase
MIVKIPGKKLFDIEADIYIIPVFTGGAGVFTAAEYGPLSAEIKRLFSAGGLREEYKKRSFYTFEKGGAVKKAFFLGLGEKEKLTPEKIREASGFAVKEAKSLGAKRIASGLFSQETAHFKAQVEGFMLADYAYDELKEKKDKDKIMSVAFPEAAAGFKKIIDETAVVADAVFFAKDLMNGPGNYTTPSKLADAAKKVSSGDKRIKLRVYSLEEAKKMGMGSFYAVAKGSDEPAKLIVAEYTGAPASKKKGVFVGKGITFDSGGISLKPQATGMSVIEDMKFDMSGAAAVIALMKIISAMKMKINAVFIAPATENLPSGKSYKPGDVLKSMSGKTIEVISTDAEGRLILCDALYFAQKYKPAFIVDIATLTGACVMALGHYATGLMGDGAEVMALMKKAGVTSGETVWELPMLEEYAETLKSKYADIKNTGEGGAGTSCAGLFLKEFTGGYPWVHLDIAGTAYGVKNKSYIPDGVAATGIRLMYEFTKNALKEGVI